METPKEYYYTYYSYEEWGRGYFGSRGCKYLPEQDIKYLGSFSDKNFNPTQKIILKSDYATREEAYADEIILQEHYKVVENPHFANKSYQTSTSFRCPHITTEKMRQSSRNNVKKLMEENRGIFSLTPEQRSEVGRKGGERVKELGVGIHALTLEQLIKNGEKLYELGIGIHSLTKQERSEIAKELYKKGKGLGSISKEKRSENSKINYKKGLEKLTKEQRSENSRKNASQKWRCLETGHISNAGGLTSYQKARDIDTSQRVRVE
jgi:hypothetical protein